MKCRNGLHEKPYPGRCLECRRITAERNRQGHRDAQKRYRRTEKGKQTQHRYSVSEKGRESQGRYYERMPFLVYSKKLLRNRRRAALKRKEKRGTVSPEG